MGRVITEKLFLFLKENILSIKRLCSQKNIFMKKVFEQKCVPKTPCAHVKVARRGGECTSLPKTLQEVEWLIQQTAKHHATFGSLSAPQWDWGDNWKSTRTSGLGQGQLDKKERKKKIKAKKLKLMMHSTIAHCLLNKAQTVPKKQQPCQPTYPSSIAKYEITDYGISF